MKKILFLMALALSLSLIALTLPDLAEAKRLGGGRSFGSKPAYSQKYQKSSPQQPNHQGASQIAPTGGQGGLSVGCLAVCSWADCLVLCSSEALSAVSAFWIFSSSAADFFCFSVFSAAARPEKH